MQLLHRSLVEEGVSPGEKVPRDVWDDLMIVAMDIGPTSINSYNRRGEAQRLWRVVEAHGKGGRGFVIFDPDAQGREQNTGALGIGHGAPVAPAGLQATA